MKKIISFIFILFCLFFSFSCKKEEKVTVTKHILDYVETEEVVKGIIIDDIYLDDYIFLGWYDANDNKIDEVKAYADIEIYAKIFEVGTKFKITYELNGGKWEVNPRVRYEVGVELTLQKPVRDLNYEFDSWYLNGEKIDKISANTFGDITLSAKWIDNNVYHDITYSILDSDILVGDRVERYMEGKSEVLPYVKRDGYYFRGWYTDSNLQTKVISIGEEFNTDLTLYPKFVEATAANTNVTIFGDSISTFEGYIPEDYITYYPQGYIDVKKVEDTWWYQVVNGLGYNLLINNSYSGTKVSSGEYGGISSKRLDNCSVDGENPDIIIIHMGTNDYSNWVSVNTFKDAYIQMIQEMKNRFDDVIIYVCTHPSNGYTNEYIEPRLEYNNVIREIANNMGLNILDLEGVITEENKKNYIGSNAHVNKAGMKAMADYIISIMSK